MTRLSAMQGGWFHTGDLATVDGDHYVLIVDRKKDIIVSGGENISSLEVEKVLVAHAAVYEAVVIPVPHEKWGEVPKALVVRKPGMHVTEAELVEFCRSRLAHYKCPAIRGLSRQLSQDRHGQDPEAGAAKAVRLCPCARIPAEPAGEMRVVDSASSALCPLMPHDR